MSKEQNPSRGERIPTKLAKEMQHKWQESVRDKKLTQVTLPNGFFLDKESIQFLLSQSKEVEGIAVTFGIDEDNTMAATVYAVKGDLTPILLENSAKSETQEEDSFVVYDRYGTCCPK